MIAYDHIQMYVDDLQSVDQYQKMALQFGKFSSELKGTGSISVPTGRELYVSKYKDEAVVTDVDPATYAPAKLDLAQQMICGLGWAVTGSNCSNGTSSVLISSPDESGARFILTTKSKEPPAKKQNAAEEHFDHFSAANVDRFLSNHAGRQGVAVLGFEVSDLGVETVLKNIKAKHPKLLVSEPHEYKQGGGIFKVLEMYAFYSTAGNGDPDQGTIMRFVERTGSYTATILPGMQQVEAHFGAFSDAAYCDHWVSNVKDRKSFLSVLEDVLSFTPKVDFNAGVVAAGEAIIESTVSGNSSSFVPETTQDSLVNQSQVYLPINNTLAPVGHVHLFLEELGQGVQHLASRVSDLVSFIQTANDFREMTGQGFSFLRIPRSYYGRLTIQMIQQVDGVSAELAQAVWGGLIATKLMTKGGIVDLDLSEGQVQGISNTIPVLLKPAFEVACVAIEQSVLKSRFANLASLLQDHLSDDTYLAIVRNKILVDIQGKDILYQIFTSNVLQRKAGEEAPFLEFIQRVCSEKRDASGKPLPIKPGCGGFGIRNFLTLFLSIEVSKAMDEFEQAESKNDAAAAAIAQKKVDTLTEQMDESNPVLTSISDAMTAEGEARTKMQLTEAERWKMKKEAGQKQLQNISDRYRNKMAELRKSK